MSWVTARVLACSLLLLSASPGTPWVQPARAAKAAVARQGFNLEQLDALAASIALYPDPLLAAILIAATAPAQVAASARWRREPAHAALAGEALAGAVRSEGWNPGVSALVPFPAILAMLHTDPGWTRQLGFAVVRQRAALLASMQRLRRQAQAMGSLQSTPEQVVRRDGPVIVIAPADPTTVHVPRYDPAIAYGTWPYPRYAPVVLALPGGGAAGFGPGVALVAGLSDRVRPEWGRGALQIDVTRPGAIQGIGPSDRARIWRPAASGLAAAPAGPVGRPAALVGLPIATIGRPDVSVPRSEVLPQAGAAPPAMASAAGTPPSLDAFAGMREGRRAGVFGARGAQSRAFAAADRPPPAAAPRAAGGPT